MSISLTTLFLNFVILFFIFILNKKNKLQIKNYKSVSLLLSLSVIVAFLGWFLSPIRWLTLIASLLNAMGISSFFNALWMQAKNNQDALRKLKKVIIISWFIWLLAISVFITNIVAFF